ncbi:MFS transporter [Nakamurella sp. YIM 132087]|uniref:MFS transporter n=1 Tax=Nakamurella alba TaxID=2665158 RepID=A0A7K1FTB3_9ACTN|nr:MFS transporter [Nakamurella alba]MTD17396.1 MFS transporter [Nakamurella alba]
MFGPYFQVLRRPGAFRFSAAGLLARMQLSMAGLGAVMLLSVERGSYAIAGSVSALYALSAAAVSPQLSRLIDVLGQRRIVPWQLVVHVPAIFAMVAVAVFTPLTWPIFVLAVIAGASQPSIGSLVRTRWSAMLRGTPELRTAFAWESLLDEVVFIAGPPLATIVALQLFPSAALILAVTLLTVGSLLLLTQRGTEPAPSGRAKARGGRPAILLPGVAGITGVFVLLGAIFGSFEVTTVAFAREAGASSVAGLLLALYAAGSLFGGLVFGVLRLRASLRTQFVVGVVVLAVITSPMPFLESTVLLGIGLFVAGLACSPVLITGTSLVERIVPEHRLTEAISWTSSGMAMGIAVATPLAGLVIDSAGASVAYWVTSGSAILASLLALLVLRSLGRAQRGAMEHRRLPGVGAPAPLDAEAAAPAEPGALAVSAVAPAGVMAGAVLDDAAPTR